MPLQVLDNRLWFPPAIEASADGLLAMGGDLRPARLLLAYRNGIFPWYDGRIPLWWCPDPRFVLFPDELKVSKSMQAVFRSGRFRFKMNTEFGRVMEECMRVPRPGQDGTWISDEIIRAYSGLHRSGVAHSAEAWEEGHLVGGLYGVKLGNVFFGESMFARASNASKFAFIQLIRHLQAEGVVLVDCQVYTEHLESLGARMIPRTGFLDILKREIQD